MENQKFDQIYYAVFPYEGGQEFNFEWFKAIAGDLLYIIRQQKQKRFFCSLPL